MGCLVAQAWLTLLRVLQGLRNLVSPDFEINMHYLKAVVGSVLDSTYHTWRSSYNIEEASYFTQRNTFIQIPPLLSLLGLPGRQIYITQTMYEVCYSPSRSRAASGLLIYLVEITNTMHRFAPLFYSIYRLLHVSAVVCYHQGASGSVWVTWKYRSIWW
jgi:hypothetical protein